MNHRFDPLARKSVLGLAGAIAALALFAAGGKALAQAQIGGALSGVSTQTGLSGGLQAAPQYPTTLSPTLKDNPSAPTPTQPKAAAAVAAAPAAAPAAAGLPKASSLAH